MDAKYWPHTNLFTIASDIKYFLLSGYQTLPFVILFGRVSLFYASSDPDSELDSLYCDSLFME